MIIIKIKIKIIILSILLAVFMYPKTLNFCISNIQNIYTAKKLNNIIVQDNHISTNPDKIKIIFMFDDGWKSIYTEAYDIMKKYNYKASVQIIPSLIGEKEYMTYKEIADLYLGGWDLLNHSYSHKENMYYNCSELLSDINKAKQWMDNRYIGKNSDILVIPYGEINPYLIEQLKDAGYHNIRTSDNIITLYTNEIEYYPVTTINLLTCITVNEVKSILTQTAKNPKAVILILHKIGDTDDGYGMTYSKEKLEQIILFINKHSDKYEIIKYSRLF